MSSQPVRKTWLIKEILYQPIILKSKLKVLSLRSKEANSITHSSMSLLKGGWTDPPPMKYSKLILTTSLQCQYQKLTTRGRQSCTLTLEAALKTWLARRPRSSSRLRRSNSARVEGPTLDKTQLFWTLEETNLGWILKSSITEQVLNPTFKIKSLSLKSLGSKRDKLE